MKLPNAHLAVIDREKITEYLLNPAHPDNGGKAAFFEAEGFRRDEWQTLADSLRKHAAAGQVTEAMESFARTQVYSRGAHRDAERRDAVGANRVDCGPRTRRTPAGDGVSA